MAAPADIEREIAYVEDRIALLSLRVGRSKNNDGIDAGETTSGLEKRVNGYEVKLKELQEELKAD